MILGLSIQMFTTLHVIISLVGIASGLVVVSAMIGNRKVSGWTALFLATTVATSLTGFLFPFNAVSPAHVVGVISLIVLAIALVALYGRHLMGAWRPAYIVSAVIALYLNVFVGVVQVFQKLPPLQTLAPTQTEGPFQVAQAVVLVLFGLLAALAIRNARAIA